MTRPNSAAGNRDIRDTALLLPVCSPPKGTAGTAGMARRRWGYPGWSDQQRVGGSGIVYRGTPQPHGHSEAGGGTVPVPAPPPVRKDRAPGTDKCPAGPGSPSLGGNCLAHRICRDAAPQR